MINFGTMLKKLRIEHSLTQSQLAMRLNELGCNIASKCVISQYENNKRTPDIETVKIIADLFYVSVDYLIGRDGINDEERIFLTLYRNVDKEKKFMLTAYATALYNAKKP